ncbi:hypothetical protein AMAG_19784 [Allomyces macrogynus ATCC 38327]|uniref:Uncharacterized protein n=1 Tax=Allomyces macrogynus (strain ATCC 38327) TaxID=578462 RepID=A0A0L0T107_ALLM3|nr:hypothetical protein AMAG_19784 [Allomyces macrogynus ATCC 38327]|eukprot:KNE68269.1 hypothetical protein AMAG_19784 [Allomyces macrogynus ATCC 38327]
MEEGNHNTAHPLPAATIHEEHKPECQCATIPVPIATHDDRSVSPQSLPAAQSTTEGTNQGFRPPSTLWWQPIAKTNSSADVMKVNALLTQIKASLKDLIEAALPRCSEERARIMTKAKQLTLFSDFQATVSAAYLNGSLETSVLSLMDQALRTEHLRAYIASNVMWAACDAGEMVAGQKGLPDTISQESLIDEMCRRMLTEFKNLDLSLPENGNDKLKQDVAQPLVAAFDHVKAMNSDWRFEFYSHGHPFDPVLMMSPPRELEWHVDLDEHPDGLLLHVSDQEVVVFTAFPGIPMAFGMAETVVHRAEVVTLVLPMAVHCFKEKVGKPEPESGLGWFP